MCLAGLKDTIFGNKSLLEALHHASENSSFVNICSMSGGKNLLFSPEVITFALSLRVASFAILMWLEGRRSVVLFNVVNNSGLYYGKNQSLLFVTCLRFDVFLHCFLLPLVVVKNRILTP